MWLSKKPCELRNKRWQRNCSSQEDTNIYSGPFFDRIHSFYFKCEKILSKMKNFILHQIHGWYEKESRRKIIRFPKIYKFALGYFFMCFICLLLFTKKALIKIKNSLFPWIYTRYEKNVKKQNCLFQRNLLICSWPFFHTSYIFSFIH